MAGRIALVGSGEYLPVMHDVEAWLLEGQPPIYVQLATAAAPEGQRSLDRWHELGREAAERLGARQVVVDVRTPQDANDAEMAALISGAGLIYLSGGNPGYLARTLAGTRVWHAIHRAWLGGASLAGCSAGAMALGGYVPDFRHPRSGGTPGLGVLPDVRVLPHFDRFTKWMPDFAFRPLVRGDDGQAGQPVVIGIDEDTALLGEVNALTEPDGENDESWGFRAHGRASAWRIGPEDVGDPVPGDPSPQAAVRRQRIVGVITLRVATDSDSPSSR